MFITFYTNFTLNFLSDVRNIFPSPLAGVLNVSVHKKFPGVLKKGGTKNENFVARGSGLTVDEP